MITPMQAQEMLLRLERNRKREPDSEAHSGTVEREADLHQQILDECRRRGYYVVHSRMDRASTQAIGVPDFVIALHGGRTAWIEAKANNSKLKPAQAAAQAWLRRDGHDVHVVRSLEDFLKVIQ